MNIICAICSQLLRPSEAISSIKCGHIFHHNCIYNRLERSRTCPQCKSRTTASSINVIYFNIANVNTDNEVDKVNKQLTLKEKELKNYKDQLEKFTNQNMELRQEVSKLEEALEKSKSELLAALLLEEDNRALKREMETMKNVHLLINGTKEQVNNILKKENNIESMATYVEALKKSLVHAQRKANKSRKEYEKLQSKNIEMRANWEEK